MFSIYIYISFTCLKCLQLCLDEKQKSISDKERVESEKSQEKIMNDYVYNEEKSVESNFR